MKWPPASDKNIQHSPHRDVLTVDLNARMDRACSFKDADCIAARFRNYCIQNLSYVTLGMGNYFPFTARVTVLIIRI